MSAALASAPLGARLRPYRSARGAAALGRGHVPAQIGRWKMRVDCKAGNWTGYAIRKADGTWQMSVTINGEMRVVRVYPTLQRQNVKRIINERKG